MPIITKDGEEFTGRVLSVREFNGYDDSDFFAAIWDDEKGIFEVLYGSTRFYMESRAVIDATPEVRQKANAWLEEQIKARRAVRAALESAVPVKSSRLMIRVAGGARIARKGSFAECVGVYPHKFKRGEYTARVVFADGGREYYDFSAVQVVSEDGEISEIDGSEAQKRLAKHLKTSIY